MEKNENYSQKHDIVSLLENGCSFYTFSDLNHISDQEICNQSMHETENSTNLSSHIQHNNLALNQKYTKYV